MVKVISDNGNFNITQSLYEAIIKNNPELLEEAGRNKAKNGNNKNTNNFGKIDNSLSRTKKVETKREQEIQQKQDEFRAQTEENVKAAPEIVQKLYHQIEDNAKRLNKNITPHQALKIANMKANDVANDEICNAINSIAQTNFTTSDFKKVDVDGADKEFYDTYSKMSADDWNKIPQNRRDDYKKRLQLIANNMNKKNKELIQNKMRILDDLKQGIVNNDQIKNLFNTNVDLSKIDTVNSTSVINYNKVQKLKNDIKKDKDPNRYKDLDVKLGNNSKLIYNDLDDFVNDEDLFKEINDAETNAEIIVKRAKGLIQKYTGNIGTNVTGNKTINQFQKYIPQQEQTVTNDNTQNNVSTETAVGESFNQINEDDSTAPVLAKDDRRIEDINNKVSYPVAGGRNIKANMQLAIGGFKFSPLFNNSSNNDAGRALKYVISALNTTNTNSHIAMMLNTLVYYKNNPDEYRQMLDNVKTNMKKSKDIENIEKGNYGTDSDTDISSISNDNVLNPVKKFTDICYSYLRNISYKLEINGEDSFQQIINVIRLDTKLSERYSINNVMSVRVLNAKEEILTFRNKMTKNIDCIIFATPLFAKGKEIAKSAQAYWDTIKRHNKV